MKLSLNWIKDYVKLPEDMDLTRLAYDLTMSTVEVEGAERLADRFDKIIVGEIKEVLPHPNADKLRVCKVDIGNGEIKDIVCGGSNLDAGMKVVVACPGSFVRWHGEGEPVEIKNAKLRGVPSFGMICASVEVGLDALFPVNDEHEIMDLTSFNAEAGTPLAVALNLDDIILEIDNKSMTNRPDLWGHYGIAREIAALYDLELVPFEKYIPTTTEKYKVEIKDTERCPRYIGTRIEGLGVMPSPFEMQSRIWRVGMRPINALVDITNYVMLATGQPTHVFDSNHIIDHIEVRKANKDEKLLLLNDKEIALSEDDLVIADAEGAVGLAGVMGGAKDSVLPETNSVILEVANFESKGIRRTALRYDNRTESSARYEKAIDPERCDQALSLAMKLFSELYPDMRVTAFSDQYPNKLERKEIDVELEWLDRRLGKRIPQDVVAKKLGTMGYEVTFTDDSMHIVVPTWRSTGDVSIKADIMEEVARMYGYENFEATSITTTFDGAINQLNVDLVRKIKEYLAFRCNMWEIFTYPWMSDECVSAIMPSTDGILALATPPSPTEKYVKCSLLPNICKAIVKNERNFEEFDIFEEAQIFLDKDYTSNYKGEKLPCQRKHLGCAFVGSSDKIADLFRHAKGVIASMPTYTHMEAFTFEKTEKPYWADEVVWQNIYHNGKKIGDIALLSKKSALACGIKVLSAILVELDMDELVPFKSRTNRFTRLSELQSNEYDVSLIIDSMTKWQDIYTAVLKGNDELPMTVQVTEQGQTKAVNVTLGLKFVDEYKGKQIPEGKKSLTIRLVISSSEKTLTSTEIEAVANTVLKKLSKLFGADIRA
ncbi:MAG: phenylalanine--tRNA ligase subunit beta [Clostridia bacterium]|nr:phenylalanine--tRNA ligase subunit beta [Clostridia bacterium]